MPAITRQLFGRKLALVAVAAMLGLAVMVATLTTTVWADDYRAGERLLPGVHVAGIDVSGMTVERATAAVEAEAQQRLDRAIEVRDGERVWTVTPRDLDARVEVEQAVAAAAKASSDTGWHHLAAVRWTGMDIDTEVSAPAVADTAVVEAFVVGVSEDVDVDPVPASAGWGADRAVVVDDEPGRTVDRAAAAEALASAVGSGEQVVELPVVEEPAAILAADVEQLLPALDAAVAATLEHPIVATRGDDTWEVPVGELASGPLLETVVEDAFDLHREGLDSAAIADRLGQLPMASDDARVEGIVKALAEEVAIAPVNAGIDSSSGWVTITDPSDGRELEREATAEQFNAALRSASDEVELPVRAVGPTRTRADFRDVLLVRQNERRLYHYRNGQIVADWPVAVGTGSQPTPTGTFTVGTKRHLPTWHNPAQDRWGADMPDMIDPGPDNPLGVRALNWNRNGADTLIRFHGTAHEDSIGRAASNGCVRMTNDDVVELYDRIPTGATIVSVRE